MGFEKHTHEEDLISISSGLVTTKNRSGKPSSQRHDDEKANLKCSHCGETHHTKEGCFNIVGYPLWWPDKKKRRTKGDNKSNYCVSQSIRRIR